MTRGRVAAARAGYLVIILVATLSNLYFDPSLADVPQRLVRAWVITPHMNDVVDAARNVLLFAGLGAVWMATSRLARPWATLLRVTLLAFVFSFGIETLQLFSPVRNASILDVTTDTLGALFGGLGAVAAFAAIDGRVGKPSYVGIPAFIFAVSYSVAALMEAFIPLFRQDLLPNLGGGPGIRIIRAWQAMQPASIFDIPRTDFLLFFPVGVFLVAALAESGVSYGAAWAAVALCGGFVCFIAEIVHGVAGEPIILGAALIHAAGIAAGALAAALTLPWFAQRVSEKGRPLLLLCAYALTILLWSWRPFRLELTPSAMAEQFSAVHLIPLRALAQQVGLFSVTDVITQFLLFVPLGALLAVWPLRGKGPLRGLAPAFYLSLVLEGGKIAVAGRFLDVTHIMIQMAGASIGLLLLRHAGYHPYGALLEQRASLSRPASPVA